MAFCYFGVLFKFHMELYFRHFISWLARIANDVLHPGRSREIHARPTNEIIHRFMAGRDKVPFRKEKDLKQKYSTCLRQTLPSQN